MLKRFAISAAALALPFAALPAVAQDKGLDCMVNSYTASQRAELAELGPRARFGDGGDANSAANAMGDIAMVAVDGCISQLGWTQEEAMYAALYELGRVSEAAFRASGQLTQNDLAAVDRALATGDRTALWASVERGLMGGMAGDTAGPSATDTIAMGAFILGTGLGEEEAVRVGILLGFMGLQRVGAREVLALQ